MRFQKSTIKPSSVLFVHPTEGGKSLVCDVYSCMFRGVLVPALVTCTSRGGITSDILTAAFKRLDDLGVYQRTSNLKPFALFDAHDSRLQVPFLRYINTPPHRWIFCIGLPDGTHTGQVGDSKEQNGSYKVE